MIWRVPVAPAIGFLIAALASTVAAGGDSRPDEEVRFAEFLLAGLRDSVDQVQSGRVRVEEVKVSSSKGEQSETRVEYSVAFDYPTGCIRFDTKRGPATSRYSRNQSHSFYFDPSAGAVVKHHADHDFTLWQSRPFDLRILGPATQGEFGSRLTHEQLWAFLNGHKPARGVRESAASSRVVFDYPLAGGKLKGRRTLWISSAKGFVVERMEAEYLLPKTDKWTLSCSSQVDWKQTSGVWVPAKAVLRDRGASSRTDLSFDWQSVNEPIDSSVFDVAGIEAPRGTSVWDLTLGNAVLDSVVGQSERILYAEMPRPSPARLVIVLANVVFLMALFWFIWHRSRRRAHEVTMPGGQRQSQ